MTALFFVLFVAKFLSYFLRPFAIRASITPHMQPLDTTFGALFYVSKIHHLPFVLFCLVIVKVPKSLPCCTQLPTMTCLVFLLPYYYYYFSYLAFFASCILSVVGLLLSNSKERNFHEQKSGCTQTLSPLFLSSLRRHTNRSAPLLDDRRNWFGE